MILRGLVSFGFLLAFLGALFPFLSPHAKRVGITVILILEADYSPSDKIALVPVAWEHSADFLAGSYEGSPQKWEWPVFLRFSLVPLAFFSGMAFSRIKHSPWLFIMLSSLALSAVWIAWRHLIFLEYSIGHFLWFVFSFALWGCMFNRNPQRLVSMRDDVGDISRT